jgi:pilus assembly protein CpaC
MNSGLKIKFFRSNVFGIFLLVIFMVPAATGSEYIRHIQLHVGAIKTLNIGTVTRVAVGRDNILSTSALESGEILLIPKEPGETDLQIWKLGGKKFTYRIRVLAGDMAARKAIVQSVLGSFEGVTVRTVDDHVLVEGEVDAGSLESFEKIAKSFPNVVSLVKAKPFSMREMVKIRLQVLEINKKYKKELGLKWGDSLSGPIVSVASGGVMNGYYQTLPVDANLDWAGALSGVGPADPYFHPYVGFAGSLASRIQLIEENGAGRTLAEPILVTRSGETASFHSGGEYPFVYFVQGEPRVEFKDYGVIVDIEPIVDVNENILVKISSEVSSIDFSTVVNGVPGILTRNTESVVNVKSGETIILSGLLSVFDSANMDKVPGLGDIPLLGALFRSKEVQENRNELIILATPEIVKIENPKNTISDYMRKNIAEVRSIREGAIDAELME